MSMRNLCSESSPHTHARAHVSLCSYVCGFSLICMEEKQRGSERESKEPKQRAVDQRKASWQQRP